jgi:CubicO group peptidase (beta-lactamase class C family)
LRTVVEPPVKPIRSGRWIALVVALALTAAAATQVVLGRRVPERHAPAAGSQAAGPQPARTAPTRPEAPVPRVAGDTRREKVAAAAARIEDTAKRRQAQWHLPGLFYGVLVDGELVVSSSLGVRDVAAGAPVTADSVFRIASMTKSFTALAILELRDAGKLALDDPLHKYVPEAASWTYPTRDSAPITVRQLLNHAEGFPEDNPWGDRQLAITDDRLTSWLREGIPFSNPPGVAYEYSNYGFALLGRIVRVASGRPYASFMRQEILEPLGLTASHWEAAAVPTDRVAHGYRWQDERWERESPLPDGAFGAMGGLYTSGRDLAKYVAFHMSAWPPRDDPESGPVRRSSVREMHQGWRHAGFGVDRPAPDAAITGNVRAYGYGVAASQDCQLGYTVAHGGGLPGYGSHMIWLPEVGIGVIAMANLTYAPASVLTRDILEILHAAAALTPRAVQPSTAVLQARDRILALLNRWDDNEVQAVAADNLFLDRSADRRKADLERIRQDVGRCTATSRLEPENWLRALFRAECERGWVNVGFTLAPTTPPRIQLLQFQAGKPLTAGMRAIADGLAAVTARADAAAVRGLLGSASSSGLAAQLDALRAHYGACRVDDVLSGDGDTEARVTYACERGRFNASLQRDAGGTTLKSLRVTRPSGTSCVP